MNESLIIFILKKDLIVFVDGYRASMGKLMLIINFKL